MLISIIVPAYKQGKTIQKDIQNICDAMSQTRWDYEVIVVVDGVLDDTYEKATEVGKKQVKVIGYEKNLGKGYAVRCGMSEAKGDLVAFIDSGMDIDASGISMLVEHLLWYDADIIVGSKKHPVSKVKYPFIRRLYSWGYYKLVKFLFGLKIKDTQTGLKIFKREVLEKVLPRLLIKEFAFDIELLAVSYNLGFDKIYEAPVKINWDYNNTSFDKFLFLDRWIRKMLWDTFAVFYRLRVLRYYDNGNENLWADMAKSQVVKPIKEPPASVGQVI